MIDRRLSKNSGMSLLELLVGMIIGSIALYGVYSVFTFASKYTGSAATQNQKDADAALVDINLKSRLGGLKNFQNLAFAVAAGKQSIGPGFYVEPDTDINGAVSTGNDRFSMVSSVVTTVELRVNGAVGPGSATIPLRSLDGTTPVANLLTAGDYLILTTVKQSELFKILGAPVPPLAANVTYALAAANFTNTFIPPGGGTSFSSSYASGDLAVKAQIVKFGIDPAAQTLVMTGASAAPQIIGTKVTSFSVYYLFPSGQQCGTFISATSTFQRDATTWGILNSSDNNHCYKKITQFQIQFTQNGNPFSFSSNTNQ